MKRLLVAVALGLLAQTAGAQLAAEGLVIGNNRNQTLAYIDKLAHGGARITCKPDDDNRLREMCISSAVTGLIIEGHAVEELRMEFFAKHLCVLEVVFSETDTEPALASLLAQMTEKLGIPTECDKETGGCEWKRDGQSLIVNIMEPDKLMLVIMELEFSNQGIWRYENQEFDDMYPLPERRTKSLTRDLSLR